MLCKYFGDLNGYRKQALYVLLINSWYFERKPESDNLMILIVSFS
jgi:hypothetical protein